MLALLLGACAEEPSPVRPTARPAVQHLVDQWHQVQDVQSDVLHLDLVEHLELSLEDSLDVGGGWRSFALPWPAHERTLSVAVGGTALERAADRAAEGAVVVFVPARSSLRAADLGSPGREVHEPLGPEPAHVRLLDGEVLELSLEIASTRAELDWIARPRQDRRARLRLFLDEEELPSQELHQPRWDAGRRTLSVEPGRHRLRLQAVAEDGDAGTAVLQIAALEVSQDGPDRVLARDVTSVQVRYQPRLPRAEERCVPSLETPDQVAFLSCGGAARITAPGDVPTMTLDGEPLVVQAGVATTAPLKPGLHRLRIPGLEAAVTVQQPMARLLPFLLHPDLRLRDDLSSPTAGSMGAELADRILSRLECQHDQRVAYWLPAPSVLTQRVELRAGDRLRFSVGVAEAPPAGAVDGIDAVIHPPETAPADAGTAALVVSLQREGHAARTLATLEGLAPGSRWQDQEVWIGADLAGAGVLRFETRAEEGARNLPVAVADPRVVAGDAGARPARPNLLVYLIDTLRADGLSCYGARNPTSPTLDALADRGYLFEDFQAVASWTRPTTASLMTALLPAYHGITTGSDGLPGSLVTFAEVLRAAGYSTWAGVSNVQVSARGVRFDQGFHRFLGVRGLGIEEPQYQMTPSSRLLTAEFLPWLERNDGEPFFLYLHSMDPHMPYVPPADYLHRFTGAYDGSLRDVALRDVRDVLGGLQGRNDEQVREDVEYVRDVYDAEVSCQDDELGRLFAALEERGLMDDTIVVVLSDHGEEFYEHGRFSHQGRMWAVHLDVPLILWVPERWRDGLAPPPRRIAETVSQVDLLPSLLELMGVEDPVPRQGLSWVPLLRGDAASPSRAVFSQEKEDLGAVRQGPWKLIWRTDDAGETSYQLFHLGQDPGEQDDQAARHPEVVQALWQLWQEWQSRQDSLGFRELEGLPATFDRDELEELKALGYGN